MPTVRERAAELAKQGLSAHEINLRFESVYGIPITGVRPETDLATLDERKAKRRAERVVESAKGSVKGVVDALTQPGKDVGLPGDAMETAPADPSKTDSTDKPLPPGMRPAEIVAMIPGKIFGGAAGLLLSIGKAASTNNDISGVRSPWADEPNRFVGDAYAAREAQLDASKQGGYLQGNLSSAGRLVEGPGAMLSAPLRPTPEIEAAKGPLDTFVKSFLSGMEGGESLVPSMIGGMGSTVKRVATGDVEAMAKNLPEFAADLIPVGKATKLHTAAAAARGNRVAGLAVRGMEAIDRAPVRAIEAGEAGIRKLRNYPGKATVEARVQNVVEGGSIGPAEAQRVLKRAAPSGTIETPGRFENFRASRLAKGAGVGVAMGGDFFGPAAAALIGTALPEAAGQILRLIPAEFRATVRRYFVNPAAQADPATQDQVARILDAAPEAADRWGRALDEAAGSYERGEVAFQPGGTTGVRPAVRSPVLTPDAKGKLVSDPDAVARRTGMAAESEAMTGEIQAETALTKPLTEAAENPPPAAFPHPADELAMQRGRADLARDTIAGRPENLDAAAGVERIDPRKKVPAQTSNSEFERLIDHAHEAVNVGGGDIPREWTARAFTDVLLPDTLTITRSYGARGKLYNLAADQLGIPRKTKRRETFMRELDTALNKIAEESLNPKPESIVLTGPNGKSLSLADLTKMLPDAIPADQLNKFRAQALRKIGTAHKQQIMESAFQRSVRGELDRFDVPTPGVRDPNLQVEHMLGRVGSGEPLPLAVKFDPEKVGRNIAGNPQAWADRVGVPVEQVQAFADKLLNDFEKADPRLVSIAGAQDGMWVRKGPHASLKGQAELLHWSGQIAQAERQLETLLKKNLTSRNLPTHITNITQNLGLLSVVDGIDPFSGMAKVADAARRLSNARKGIARTPAEQRMWRDLFDAGLQGTTMLESEVGTIGRGNPPVRMLGSKVLGKVGLAGHHAGKIADAAYQLGDVAFKGERAERFYLSAMRDLDELERGRYVTYSTADGRLARIERGADGNLLIDGKAATEDAVSRTVAKAAMRKANDLFFDYRRSPLLLTKARKAAQAIGAASPYYTWFFNALDLPGKPGLFSRALGEGGSMSVLSNSPTILTRNANAALQLATRRMALNAGLRAQIDQDPEGMAKAMTGLPRDQRAMLVAPAADPGMVWIDSWNNNSFLPTEMLFRGGSALGAAIMDPEDLFDPAKETFGRASAVAESLQAGKPITSTKPITKQSAALRRIWSDYESGQLAPVDTALQLAGASGGLLMNTFQEVDKARRGQKVSWSKVMADVGRLAIGGTPGQLVNVPFLQAGRRRIEDADGPGNEDPTAFAVRQILSVGYQQAWIEGSAKKYLDRMDTALKNGLNVPSKESIAALENDAMRAKNAGRPEDAADATAEAKKAADDRERLLTIIDRVMSEERARTERYERLLDGVAPNQAQP